MPPGREREGGQGTLGVKKRGAVLGVPGQAAFTRGQHWAPGSQRPITRRSRSPGEKGSGIQEKEELVTKQRHQR